MADIPSDPHGPDAPELVEQDESTIAKARGPLLSRRALLASIGATGLASGALALTGGEDGGDGFISGGTADLDQGYHVGGGLYIGPDSAKGTVSPEAGRYYLASDTEKEYYGDGNSWTWKGINAPTVATDDIDITPVKIGIIGDTHYPSDLTAFGFVGQSETETKLNNIASELDDWGADYVFTIGDMTKEESTKSESQQNITDFRALIEDKIGMELNPVWGNHEYAQAATWGTDWSYPPWDISTDSDTYYTVDVGKAVIMVLNSGYSTDDGTRATEFTQNQIDWIETTLNSITKPVLVLSHLPLSIGNGESYDRAEREAEVGSILARYDNVVGLLHGHCHHDAGDAYHNDSHPNPYFDQDREQSAYGLRNIHVHWTQRRQNDSSITPYYKLYVYPSGEIEARATAVGRSEPYRVYRFNASGSPVQSREGWASRSYENVHLQYEFESLDGWGSPSGGGSTSVSFDTGARLTTSVDGDAPQLFKQHDWPAEYRAERRASIWRVYANFVAIQDATVRLYWGSKGEQYVGYRIDNGTCEGVVYDGNERSAVATESSISNGEKRLMEFRIIPSQDRVDFMPTAGRAKKSKGAVTLGSPSGDAKTPFWIELEQTGSTSQELQIMDAELITGPTLDIEQ